MDDDLIRRALGSGVEADPPPTILTRALAMGTARHRRRVAGFAAGAALVAIAVIAGAVAVSGQRDEQIVGVSPSTVLDVAPETTPAPTQLRPAPTAPAPLRPEPTIPATSTPAASTTPASTSTFTPLRTSTTFGSRTVAFAVDAEPPAGADAFAALAPEGRLQLWSFSGAERGAPEVSAWMTVEPCSEDAWCARSLAYDGRFLWVELDPRFADDGLTQLEPSLLVRADVATGAVEAVPIGLSEASPSPGQVLDLLPAGAGGAAVVTELDASVSLLSVGSDLAITGEATVPITTGGVISARLNTGSMLAYSWAVPREGVSSVRVIDLVTGVERVLLDPAPVYPVVRAWSQDETRLLVADEWEDRSVLEVSSSETTSTTDALSADLFADGCYSGDGSLIVGRWRWGYAESPAEPGSIEIVSADRSAVTPMSEPIVGGALACLGNGSVATRVWTMHPDGETVLARTGVVISRNGDQLELGPDIEPVPMRTVE